MGTEVVKSKAELRRERMRGTKETGDGVRKVHVDDCTLFQNTLEVLVARAAGKDAKGGRIGIYVRNGKLQCVIQWPEAGVYGYVPCTGFTGLLEEVERLLASDAIDWLIDEPKGSGKRF